MNEFTIIQALIISADLLVMLSFVMGLYVIALNPRTQVNRLIGVFILILALVNLAVVVVFRTADIESARYAHILLVAFVPAIFPAVLTSSLLLLRGDWFVGRRRSLIYVQIVWISFAALLTVFDLLFETNLYYTGFRPFMYKGGLIPLQQLAAGPLGWPILLINVYITPVITLLPLGQAAFFDRRLPVGRRNLARLLIVVQVFAILAFFLLPLAFQPGIQYLVVNGLFIAVYAYLAFAQQVSERRKLKGRLQPRLTALILAIILPMFVALTISFNNQTQQALEDNTALRLEQSANSTAAALRQWLELSSSTLQTLAIQPAVIQMEADAQQMIFQSMLSSYRFMDYISSASALGETVARSDGEEPQYVGNALWFQTALKGRPIVYQTQVNPTTGVPELVMATAYRNSDNAILGAVMFSMPLTTLNDQIASQRIGETGFVYMVDERGYLVSHPGLGSGEVNPNEFAFVAPVDYARRQGAGVLDFTDLQGDSWFAYVMPLENDWVIVAQQQAEEVLAPAINARNFAIGTITVSGLVLLFLTWATMRQAFEPFKSLTDTAQAIARGDLRRVAPVESEDEFGTLARSFNSMTAQLVELIDNLELRVQERTQDLERRTMQLKAATEVGRAVATLHDLDRLLSIVTRLISESFGFYHVGIFLLDNTGENAVLRAANSEGGQRMLEKGHVLKVGQQGIVGYATQRREPRIALNVGEDSAHFVNPYLPETRSEMALPLIVGGQLLGALDVQSRHENAFSQHDVETLQVLADQVAIAISNANLVAQTQELLESERRAYRDITRMNWREFSRAQHTAGYVRTNSGLDPIEYLAPLTASSHLNEAKVDAADPQLLVTPVIVRGEVIALLRTRKPEYAGGWAPSEIAILTELANQLALALESARAYHETQIRATQERIASQITADIRQNLDLESMLRTATREVRRSMGLSKVLIQIVPPGDHAAINSEAEPGSNGSGHQPLPPDDYVASDSSQAPSNGSKH